MNLSEYIKKNRIQKDLSQGELAKTLGYSNGQFVSNWENERSYPPTVVLKKLCTVLKMDRKKVYVMLLVREKIALKKALSL